LDIVHRIIDLPLLAFVLEGDTQANISFQTGSNSTNAFISGLMESVTSDQVGALSLFWLNNTTSEWNTIFVST
jgi:hypothetical protein